MTAPEILWTPSPDRIEQARITDYVRWLGRGFSDYDALWRWSVEDLEGFWGSVAEYFGVRWRTPPRAVIGGARVRGPLGDRPLRADRADGAADDRRLPLRRPGLRAARPGRGDRCRDAGRADRAARLPRRNGLGGGIPAGGGAAGVRRAA